MKIFTINFVFNLIAYVIVNNFVQMQHILTVLKLSLINKKIGVCTIL